MIDVNDNEPSFTNLPYRVDVPEVGLVSRFRINQSIYNLFPHNCVRTMLLQQHKKCVILHCVIFSQTNRVLTDPHIFLNVLEF